MTALWYYEQRNGSGWMPCTSTAQPKKNSDKRLVRNGSVGPVIRRVSEVPEDRRMDGLDALQVTYSEWGEDE